MVNITGQKSVIVEDCRTSVVSAIMRWLYLAVAVTAVHRAAVLD